MKMLANQLILEGIWLPWVEKCYRIEYSKMIKAEFWPRVTSDFVVPPTADDLLRDFRRPDVTEYSEETKARLAYTAKLIEKFT